MPKFPTTKDLRGDASWTTRSGRIALLMVLATVSLGGSACGARVESLLGTGSGGADALDPTLGSGGSSVDEANASGGRSDVDGTGNGGAEAGGTGGGALTGSGGEPTTVPSHQILTIDEADIENASGDQLLELAGVIGDARGYAMCDCYSTTNPGEFTQEELEACAEAETGLLNLSGQESEQRCVRDLSRELPGFDDFLRCQLQVLRLQAIEYLECSDGPFGIETDRLPCQDEDPMGADALLRLCEI